MHGKFTTVAIVAVVHICFRNVVKNDFLATKKWCNMPKDCYGNVGKQKTSAKKCAKSAKMKKNLIFFFSNRLMKLIHPCWGDYIKEIFCQIFVFFLILFFTSCWSHEVCISKTPLIHRVTLRIVKLNKLNVIIFALIFSCLQFMIFLVLGTISLLISEIWKSCRHTDPRGLEMLFAIKYWIHIWLRQMLI